MPPSKAPGPRRSGSRRPRRVQRYNVAGVIDLQEAGVLEASDRLERIVRNARDPETIKGAIPPLEMAERRLFRQHGQGRWQKKKDGSDPDLYETGALFKSLTESNAPGAIRKPLRRGTQLRFGSKLVQGVMQKRAGRDAVAIDDKGREAVVEQVRDRLLG